MRNARFESASPIPRNEDGFSSPASLGSDSRTKNASEHATMNVNAEVPMNIY